jgi:hypothetical protein
MPDEIEPVETPVEESREAADEAVEVRQNDEIIRRLEEIEEKINGLTNNANLMLLLEMIEEQTREDTHPSGGSKLYRPLFGHHED